MLFVSNYKSVDLRNSQIPNHIYVFINLNTLVIIPSYPM